MINTIPSLTRANRRGCKTIVFCLLILNWLLVASAEAGGIDAFLIPRITDAEHKRVVEILHFEPQEVAAADRLHSGYTGAFHAEAAIIESLYERRETAVKSKSDDAKSLSLAFHAAFVTFCKRRETSVRDYTSSLRALLSDDQANVVWPS